MFNADFPFYGFAILAALVSNVIVVMRVFPKYSFDKREIICLLLYENVGIIAGAKIFSFLLSYKELNGAFDLASLGLTSYGGALGASAFILLFCLQFHKSPKEAVFIFLPPFPLMYGFGKIGCFLTGCCCGVEYNGVFKIMYRYSEAAPNNINLFPVQAVEAIIFFAIFVYLFVKQRENSFSEKTAAECLIMCSVAKFITDYFRMNHENTFLSVNQAISIAIMLAGITLIFALKKKLV